MWNVVNYIKARLLDLYSNYSVSLNPMLSHIYQEAKDYFDQLGTGAVILTLGV